MLNKLYLSLTKWGDERFFVVRNGNVLRLSYVAVHEDTVFGFQPIVVGRAGGFRCLHFGFRPQTSSVPPQDHGTRRALVVGATATTSRIVSSVVARAELG